jgi:hypothetical protein
MSGGKQQADGRVRYPDSPFGHDERHQLAVSGDGIAGRLMPLKPRTIAVGLLLVALFSIGGSISIAAAEARKPGGQTRHLIL